MAEAVKPPLGLRARRRIDLLNGAAVAVLIGISAALGAPGWTREVPGSLPSAPEGAPAERAVRIVSGSAVIDRLLVELCEPDRIAAFSEFTKLAPESFRYRGRPTLDGRNDAESILALRPDLVIVHNLASLQRMQQLRAHGVRVVDLGIMGGAASLVENMVTVGRLVGNVAVARRLAQRFSSRMASLAAAVPTSARKTAIYLGVHTGKLMGGTGGTSFHDVLAAAGLVDAAAPRFSGWPHYVAEQILELDPEVVVTQLGMKDQICGQAGFDRLRACGPGGRIVEVETEWMLDSGLPMLEAAERVFEAVYGVGGARVLDRSGPDR